MNLNDIWKIVLGIITSVGGIGLIIIGISKYLGNLFANKYVEKIKKDFEKEVEEYKTHLDIRKSTTLRYSEKQFEYYSKLWASLYDLKLSADKLWENASLDNLEFFTKQLKNTKTKVEKSGLFIENNDYENLVRILNYFLDYKIGKTKLINIRENNPTDFYHIQQLVDNNQQIKNEYDQLILRIKEELKNQIRGNNIRNIGT